MSGRQPQESFSADGLIEDIPAGGAPREYQPSCCKRNKEPHRGYVAEAKQDRKSTLKCQERDQRQIEKRRCGPFGEESSRDTHQGGEPPANRITWQRELRAQRLFQIVE